MGDVLAEYELSNELYLLRQVVPGLLAEAAQLLDKSALKVDREALAQEITHFFDSAMDLVHKALESSVKWSGSELIKQVAKEAQEIADQLYDTARKLRGYSMKQMEEALEVALGELRESAPGPLIKAVYLLVNGAQHWERREFAKGLENLARTAISLVHQALGLVKWSGSAVGKEGVEEAQETADLLTEMAIKMRREYYPSIEQMEEATHDADVLALAHEVDAESMKREIEEVEPQVEEVARLLKEHVELSKVGEAGDNHPHESDENKEVTS